MDTGSATQGGVVYAVYDYRGASHPNCSAWGKDAENSSFCCYIDDPDNKVWYFLLLGVPSEDDYLYFQNYSHSMEDPSTGAFVAKAKAGSGDDWFKGS